MSDHHKPARLDPQGAADDGPPMTPEELAKAMADEAALCEILGETITAMRHRANAAGIPFCAALQKMIAGSAMIISDYLNHHECAVNALDAARRDIEHIRSIGGGGGMHFARTQGNA